MSAEKTRNRIKLYIEKHGMLKSGDTCIVGLSGGADSVCLLLVLNELKDELGIKLCALHFEHGIRGVESLRDAKFSENLCEKNGIPFTLVRSDIPAIAKELKIGEEEAGRLERYKAFDALGKRLGGTSDVKIAVAHHANDNAETVLFNIARGSGIDGATGIKPILKRREGSFIIRPLLCIKRNDIEEYLKEKDEDYCTDATNANTKYSRNRIRNSIIPELCKINSSAVEHFEAFSEEMEDIQDFIREETDALLREILKTTESDSKDVCKNEYRLLVKGLLDAHPFIRRATVKRVLVMAAGREKDLHRNHVDDILGLLNLQTGRRIDLPYELSAYREYDYIVIGKKAKECEGVEKPDINELFEKRIISAGKWDDVRRAIPKKQYTKWFDYDKIKGVLSADYPLKTDKICIDDKGHTKSVPDYLKNEKVPSKIRQRVLILKDEREVVWVVGHRISERYKVTEETKSILEIKYLKEEDE